MTTGCNSRRGFTLVELLVVIAIIGILVALLLPAIQAAREAARRSSCSNNLKQMGLALHGYHDSHKAFPSGVATGTVGGGEQGFGWAVALLPYMEEHSLYDLIHPDWKPRVFQITFNATGKIVPGGDRVVQVFRCPSSEMEAFPTDDPADDRLPPWAEGYATSDYKGCNGSDTGDTLAAGSDTIGIFCTQKELKDVAKRIKLGIKDVTDGLNQTLAFGESAYYQEPEIEKWPYWIGGVMEDESVLFKTNEDNPIGCEISPKAVDGFATAKSDECAFSWHSGGAFFGFADGSVHFLQESIDLNTYRNLGNIADGNVVSDYR